jgi:hypothetical protein
VLQCIKLSSTVLQDTAAAVAEGTLLLLLLLLQDAVAAAAHMSGSLGTANDLSTLLGQHSCIT